jgi:putative ABC transport system ATP-binding protein
MTTPLLDIQSINLKVPGIDNPILKDINYQVKKGDFVIILGSNGSGKSSLLKLVDRRYQQTTGRILLEGKSISALSLKTFSKKIITLTQNCNDSLFTSLTVLENYLLVKQRHEHTLFSFRDKKERAFFAEYIKEFNPNLSVKLDQTVDKLSGGEKQALALALSVLYPPDVLLLDEHTSALDPKTGQQLMALTQRVVAEHHITCMLTTHDLNIAMHYGNRILALKHGTIHKTIEPTDKSTVSSHALLEACY